MSLDALKKPFGPPIGCYEIPADICRALNDLVDSNCSGETTDLSGRLAGQVTEELALSQAVCQEIGLGRFLANMTMQYIQDSTGKKITEFTLLEAWIVRQFAGEYNPIHWHSGHISGAGWLMVPENMSTGSKKPGSYDGSICFTHGSRQFLSNSTYSINPRPGLITIFPHYLMHSVYPFHVEGERRSLAFNALVDESIFDVYG
jgi:hypothetical protein